MGGPALVIHRGDLWWAELPNPSGRRPVVVLSREEACQVRSFLTVAPVTTRVRGLPVEVGLGPDEGLTRICVANLDSVVTIAKPYLVERISHLAAPKLFEVDRALRFALGLR